MILNLFSNLSFYIPEVLVIITMCSLLFIESSYGPAEKERKLVFIAATIGLVLAFVSLMFNLGEESKLIFANAVVIDKFSTLLKMIMVLGTLGVVYLSKSSLDIYRGLKSEFLIMVMGVLVGGMLLASANNLLTVYLGIETLSILSYVLTSFKRHEATSTEAGIKYALYGGISAGVMLFGMSHIYGLLGTIQFAEMLPAFAKVQEAGQQWLMMASFIMFFVGIGYKIACVPFHMWSPDVYQGSPIPVTTFFSIVPKMAGIAVLVRVSLLFFGESQSAVEIGWFGLIQIIAALTMSVGNISAIGQDSMKRLLAYSSIGHVGMMLLGVLTLNTVGPKIIVFYGINYLFMTLVAFYITSAVSDKFGSDSQASFKGLVTKNPFMAILMSISLFSLAGLPPFSGFIAKFNMLAAVVDAKYYGLAFVAAVNSVISLYYYVKVVKVMIFSKAEMEGPIDTFRFSNQALIALCTLPVIILGLFWDKLMLLSEGAKIFIQQ
ncbi:MAG: NADH-quinone oxidoreductase subunit N [Bacteriovoracaceae bacterium]|nr:NADH-quinone oxidoreductase subunit N [Bacteriovoracaceae bacterium]